MSNTTKENIIVITVLLIIGVIFGLSIPAKPVRCYEDEVIISGKCVPVDTIKTTNGPKKPLFNDTDATLQFTRQPINVIQAE